MINYEMDWVRFSFPVAKNVQNYYLGESIKQIFANMKEVHILSYGDHIIGMCKSNKIEELNFVTKIIRDMEGISYNYSAFLEANRIKIKDMAVDDKAEGVVTNDN